MVFGQSFWGVERDAVFIAQNLKDVCVLFLRMTDGKSSSIRKGRRVL